MSAKFNKIEKEYVEEYNKRIDIINELVLKFNNAPTNLFYIALYELDVNVSECKVKLYNNEHKIKRYYSHTEYSDSIEVVIVNAYDSTIGKPSKSITYETIDRVLHSDNLLEKFAELNIFNTHKEASRYAIQKQISDLERDQIYRRSPKGARKEEEF